MNQSPQVTAVAHSSEPIAIIGIGCRFPGKSSGPEAFWNNLLAGKDCIVDVPSNRWDVKRFYDADKEKPGKMYVKSGGFLHESIDEFDALFFGISPREAAALDPQQRLLLEVSWEALEDAGIDPESLAGSSTGVFVGGFMLDNKLTQLNPLNRHTIASNTAVGMTLTMLSNRISYLYDLRGPSMSIDTACSSSMVALDQACRSIWSGDSSLALVGGVNVMHRPEIFIAMCKGGFLAPDGRSKAFDERGDGYGRGEGAGLVVLKKLSEAERDGDNIYALIRATGCNQDGRTDGITVPNPQAQQALIRKVTAKAGVALNQIQYFEAHGTGTAVGDPIEMSAIGGTVGQAQAEGKTCLVGSVKGNIGHLEAASGIAAVIKASLSLQHQQVPPQANLINLNPKIPFDQWQLKVPRQVEPLNANNQAIYAGINSFGYGGTNACALLQNYQKPLDAEPLNAPLVVNKMLLLPISAKSKNALLALAQRYRDLLQNRSDYSLSDICYSAGAKRAQLNYRVCFRARTRAEFIAQLDDFINQRGNEKWVEGQLNEADKKLAFVFTGMGPQWWAMGRELMQTEPVFMQSVKESDEVFQKIAGWSILEEMLKNEEESRVSDTVIAQPANFVLQKALVDLWRSWGVEPAAVVGHSVGEVTTAYVSGILTLEQALLVSFHRSRIQKKAAGQGSMLAVGITEADALAAIAPFNGSVSIAAINAPTAITLAGDDQALAKIAKQLTAKELFNRALQVEVAYHSPTMDPLLPEIRTSLAALSPAPAQLPSYSTVTGERIETTAFDGEYWCRNVREPVYFFRALEQMIADGYTDFLEVGPHPVLSSSIKECFTKHKLNGFLTTSLKRKTDEQDAIKRACAELYTLGYGVNWAELSSTQFIASEQSATQVQCVRPQYVRLPNYPWQKERYWNDAQTSLVDRIGQEIPLAALGAEQEGPGRNWLSQVNDHYFPHLQDHKVEDLVILAGATYVEAGLEIHKALTGSDACLISNLSLHNAMVLDADAETLMHASYDAATGNFSVDSYKLGDKSQTRLHATGTLAPLNLVNHKTIALEAVKQRCDQQLQAADIYRELDTRGLQYGPYFQGIKQLWRRDAEVLALIQVHPGLEMPSANYQLHPSLLDACFQSLISALPSDSELVTQVYVPVSIRQLRHYQKVGASFYCLGSLSHMSGDTITGDIFLCDAQGQVLVEIRGLRCQALRAAQTKTLDNLDDWTYQPGWQPLEALPEVAENTDKQRFVLFLNDDALSKSLLHEFTQRDQADVCVVYSGNRFEVLGDNAFSIDGSNKAHLNQLFKDYLVHKAAGKVSLVYAWGLAQKDLDPVHLKATSQLLDMLKQLDLQEGANRLYLLTRDAARVSNSDKVLGFQQSPLIGLGRVAAVEMAKLEPTLIDLPAVPSAQDLHQLYLETYARSPELELAVRDGQRFGYRLRQISLAENYQPNYVNANKAAAFVLAHQGLGQNTRTEWQVAEEPVVGTRQVQLAVMSCLVTPEQGLGGQDFGGQDLGGQHLVAPQWRQVSACVSATGEQVKGFALGDEIIALYQGPLGSHINVDDNQLIALKKPAAWSPEQAAPALLAYALAHEALVETAHLSAADSLLVIGADSALGQAAVQLAALRRCDTLQVTRDCDSFPLNSASLTEDLAAAIYRKGHPEGFDVILNLCGPQPNLNLDKLLAKRGCYIALGEQQMPVALSATKTQVCISEQSLLADKQAWQQRLPKLEAELAQLGERGLSTLNYSAAELHPACSHEEPMPTVVSLYNRHKLQLVAKNSASFTINPNASYLITGGFGGFGLGMAHWLVAQGAKSLVLVSRSGASSTQARAAVAELIAKGAKVKAAAVDIAKADAVHELLQAIAQDLPPLKGIFHAAGVLDDRELSSLDEASLAQVMAPKALGAWNLHQQTHQLDLDCFVLYSSISALIGNRNQANYVAANLFLDALAQHRQAQGLAATSINWGALADVGMAADPNVIGHLAQIGINAFTQAQALEAFSYLLRAPVAQLGIFNVDWARWKQFEVAGKGTRFSELAGGEDDSSEGASWAQVASLGSELALPQISTRLAELVANTLKLTLEQIDLTTPINRFGLDSLMAMDLQMKVRGEFKVDLSILELMKGNSTGKLAESLLGKLLALGAEAASKVETTAPADTATGEESAKLNQLVDQLNHLDQLSEAELDALLKQELSNTDKEIELK